MKSDILKVVIAVEQDIKQRLEIERKKAADWLEKVKQEAAHAVNLRESDLQLSTSKTVADARSLAQAKADQIVDEAQKNARILEEINDSFLKKIISAHLGSILPGEK